MYSYFRWTQPSLQRNAILRTYEPIQPYVLMSLAEKVGCEVFIDVGANIGAYSLFLSTIPTVGEIHAFEPSPDSFKELQKNVELNRLADKISPHQQAVSAKGGALLFGLAKALSGTNGVVSTSIHDPSSFHEQIKVEAVTLDEALPIEGKRICLKIDVEGHERDALLGMRHLLSRNSAVVQIEHYERGRDYMDIFEEVGFREIFQLGADLFLTNAELSPEDVIEAFEGASALAIDAAKTPPKIAPSVSIRFGKWVKLQLDGPLAGAARRTRTGLRHLLKR